MARLRDIGDVVEGSDGRRRFVRLLRSRLGIGVVHGFTFLNSESVDAGIRSILLPTSRDTC